jgi:hypothetical protein
VAFPIADYLVDANDPFAPTVPNPALQQYDNYQIYNIYCTDRPVEEELIERKIVCLTNASPLKGDTGVSLTKIVGGNEGVKQSFLAVQAYNPTPITVDFHSIIESHYSHSPRTVITGTSVDNIETIAVGVPVWDATLTEQSAAFHNALDLAATKGGVTIVSTCSFKRAPGITTDIFVEHQTNIMFEDVPADYIDLLGGYSLDNRSKPVNPPAITIDKSGYVRIGYYRENNVEPIPGLRSIDWHEQRIDIAKDKLTVLPIVNPVLGTVIISGDIATEVIDAMTALSPAPNTYSWNYFIYGNVDPLFDEWAVLFNAKLGLLNLPGILSSSFFILTPFVVYTPLANISIRKFTRIFKPNKLRVLAANNNVWSNQVNIPTDINPDPLHPMFLIDDDRAYDWHVLPQPDGSIGNLIMDSPNTIAIANALGAFKYGYLPSDPTLPSEVTLGDRILKISELLGYRPEEDGTYSVATEKTKARRIVPDKERIKEEDYGGNYYANKGMLVKRSINGFNSKGKIVSGGVAMIHDIPQLIVEMQDQLNMALGLQESGAIEIKDGDRTYRYPNQLALLTDLALSVAAIHQLAHQAYVSSLVCQQQTKEIISGMGLPTVNRSTNITIDNKLEQVPYWGVAPQHSLARKIDTVAYNVGIVTGQLI